MTQESYIRHYKKLIGEVGERSMALLKNIKVMILNDSKLKSETKKYLLDYINNML